MIIGIDHGNSCIKTASQVFTSGYSKFIDEPPLASDLIKYNGSYYALSGKRLPYRRDKTENDDFYILTLFAIAKEIEQAGLYKPEMDLQLAIGLPPAYFGALKDTFSEYFIRGRRYVNFLHNNLEYTIRVTKTYVFPQAYPAIYSRYAEIKSMSKLFIIDIGGFTTDILLVKHGTLDMNCCYSLDSGIIKLYSKAKAAIAASFGGAIDETDIDNILNGKNNLIGSNEKNVIFQCSKEHTMSLLDSLSEYEIDTRYTPIMFTGGGALLLKPFILQSGKVTTADFISNTTANAKGYQEMARTIEQREQR